MKRILIANDPERKNDDITYLKDKLYGLVMPDTQFLIVCFTGYDDIAKMIGDYRDVLEAKYRLINPALFDFALVMPDCMLEGFTGAIVRKLKKYNPSMVFTF